MLDWNQCSEVELHADVMSGTWVFKGTRIQVKALFLNLEDGATVDEFVAWFPGVSRHQVEAALAFAEKSLTAP